MKFKKNSTIFLLTTAMVFLFLEAFTQVPHVKNSCFCIEESNAQPNILYKYRVNYQDWVRSATIEYKGDSRLAERIEAMAINPVDGIIYAFDGNKFGTIKIGSQEFELINSDLSGNGIINGSLFEGYIFSDIDGLTYNPYTRELWATNRQDVNLARDLLFKLNPETGEVIKGIFNGYDFVEVEESFDSTLGGAVYDVEDIAINPFTDQLFAIQNQNGPGIITEVNKTDGSIETEIFDLNEDDVEGLGFSGYGFLYGTTGDNSDVPSSLIAIDFLNSETEGLDPIDRSLPGGIGDFESFDCLSDYVDLALDAKVKHQNEFGVGDIVNIDVTVHNQGTIDIDDLEVTMHLPSGMTILSSGWLIVSAEKRKIIITENEQSILAGISYEFSVQIRIDNPTTNNYSIPFEISSVKNQIISISQGYEIELPDVDSTPDSENFETNVKNNEINQNGKFHNEDEDDHDTASFTIDDNDCPQNLVLPNINEDQYNAQNSIETNGSIVSNNGEVEIYAGTEITFGNGFEVKIGGELTADIQGCP